jgi:hypothetical protein
LLTVGGSSGPAWAHELTAPYRRMQGAAAARQWSSTRSPACAGAPPCDRGAAFQVHELLARQREHGAPSPRREVILAAYRAHLAGRIRYSGPLTPVDLHI